MAAVCPVCTLQFDEGAVFALHVATCTTPAPAATPGTPSTVPSSATVTASSCPMCHMVYTSAMLAHEIEFHEFECERVNPRPDTNATVATGSASSGAVSGGKRSRESLDASDASTPLLAATTPAVKLFPSHCAICETGGRTLLHCAGRCARSFHPMCIDEINQRSVAFPTSSSSSSSSPPAISASAFVSNISRDRKAMRQWVCGDCARGVHTCQLCGFLGHDVHDLVHCSVTDCGFSFHPACLADRSFRSQLPLVCPRHTCATCHAIETDLTKCSSCTRCVQSTHIRCSASAATTAPASVSASDLLDPNFCVCASHDPAATTTRQRIAQSNGLKMRLRPGDVVLVLEYNNRLLPESATRAAPTACNQWGIVQRVEEISTTTWYWNQLLSVTLFSDGSEISVLNRDVLAVGAVTHFSTPVELVRECLKWHAMSEARLLGQRQLAVTATNSAFHARVRGLAMTDSQCAAAVAAGVDRCDAFGQAPDRVFGQVEAPVHVLLDTRPKAKDESAAAAISSVSASTSDGASNAPSSSLSKPQGGGDVEMEDATDDSSSKEFSLGPHGRQHAMDSSDALADVMAVMNGLLTTLEASEKTIDVNGEEKTMKMAKEETTRVVLPAIDLKRPQTSELDGDRLMKRVKREPTTVRFTHLPVTLHKKPGSVFARSPALQVPPATRKLREQMTSLPSSLIGDLEQQVDAFFGDGRSTTRGALPLPMVRPAFYRPSPFLYCGPRLRQQRRIDSISRLLVCQDKRNVKCFVESAPYSSNCRALSRYMSIDLLAHGDVAALHGAIGSRLSGEVAAPTRLRELRYCAVDGTQHALVTDADWLCFCANVCHLIAIVA
ncbi:hypothetical protein PINS_up006482 [Pythium insidiosum]|nr:hypothetical protein PINS_up006482 [Pythium insidiosum]